MHQGIPQTGLQALATPPSTQAMWAASSGIIRHGETGRLIPPGAAAALARAIRETLEEREATRRFCEQGRALVERDHSLEGMLDQLEVLYRSYLPKAC